MKKQIVFLSCLLCIAFGLYATTTTDDSKTNASATVKNYNVKGSFSKLGLWDGEIVKVYDEGSTLTFEHPDFSMVTVRTNQSSSRMTDGYWWKQYKTNNNETVHIGFRTGDDGKSYISIDWGSCRLSEVR